MPLLLSFFCIFSYTLIGQDMKFRNKSSEENACGSHDSTEHLVVYVPVQMFHQLPVGESGV